MLGLSYGRLLSFLWETKIHDKPPFGLFEVGCCVSRATNGFYPVTVYEMELTYTFKYELTRLTRRSRHLVNAALEEILACPTDKPGRIILMSTTEEDLVFRYRLPGIHLFYRIPHKRTHIIMTQLKKLKKGEM